jgi:hypothetical protein
LLTEKAGVGGSTPSLATTFQSTQPNALGGSSPLSVRIPRHAEDGRCSRTVLKDLGRTNSSSVRSQSALVSCVAENRRQHFPCCSHAIPTDRVRVELKRKLDVAVAKQRLHGLWIGSDTDEKRRETVAQIVKTESPWVVIDQPSSEVPVR